MRYPITHATWQTLRVLARSKKPVIGRDLRISWTNRTKDGTFLLELVRFGLIEHVLMVTDKPFDSLFQLTAAGKFAAEYGEYECDDKHVAVIPQPTNL